MDRQLEVARLLWRVSDLHRGAGLAADPRGGRGCDRCSHVDDRGGPPDRCRGSTRQGERFCVVARLHGMHVEAEVTRDVGGWVIDARVAARITKLEGEGCRVASRRVAQRLAACDAVWCGRCGGLHLDPPARDLAPPAAPLAKRRGHKRRGVTTTTTAAIAAARRRRRRR
eukprot:scaffold103034_cov67-Phaeocystis_antarctica.AAC.5